MEGRHKIWLKMSKVKKTTSPESDVTLVTQEQKGIRALCERFRNRDKSERCKTKKIEKTQDEYDSDKECKALVRRFHEKKHKFTRVHKLLDVESSTQEQEERIRE